MSKRLPYTFIPTGKEAVTSTVLIMLPPPLPWETIPKKANSHCHNLLKFYKNSGHVKEKGTSQYCLRNSFFLLLCSVALVWSSSSLSTCQAAWTCSEAEAGCLSLLRNLSGVKVTCQPVPLCEEVTTISAWSRDYSSGFYSVWNGHRHKAFFAVYLTSICAIFPTRPASMQPSLGRRRGET